ncbi:MAG: M14 metallopeptidase family protein [Kofleriaceae bacterium]
MVREVVALRLAASAWCWIALALACAVTALATWPLRSAPSPTRFAVAVEPRTDDELAIVTAMSLDTWSEHAGAGEPIVVVLTRDGIEALAARGISHEIVVQDIAAAASKERDRLAHRSRLASSDEWFSDYRDLEEVTAYLDRLVDRHPSLSAKRDLGASVEGRSIAALEIGRGGNQTIVLNGGQHAREWVSVMVPMCIADRILESHDRDPRLRRILDTVSFVIVPVVNPDGYVHTWTVDRYWRKNRRGGYGVDLNRNYDVGWGGAGSSPDRSSPNYRGEHPSSEPETQAMRSLFERANVAAHIDFHSYSQVIVYPWSYQRAEPDDRTAFEAIAARMSEALEARQGQPYAIRPGSQLKTGAGGTLGDWAYGATGALSFLIELRPANGPGGFVLPPEQIVPTCEESLAAVLELAESISEQ